MNHPHPEPPQTFYGMFSGHESDTPLPGALQLAGTDTRLTVWSSNNKVPVFSFSQPVHGDLHTVIFPITLWGLHEVPPCQPKRVIGPMVGASTYAPTFGVHGAKPFIPDETPISAITLTSPHLRLHDEPMATAVTTDFGVLTVSTDTRRNEPFSIDHLTRIELAFDKPLHFAEAAFNLKSLLFLCEAITGRPHNFEGVFLSAPDASGATFPYRCYDFLADSVPPYTLTGGTPHPVCSVGDFLPVAAGWLKKFHLDDYYPEIFEHFSASLALTYKPHIQRLRVFQSVNVFDLFPKKPSVKRRRLEDVLEERINLVADAMNAPRDSYPRGFTAENLRKFAKWGAGIRNRMVHGPLAPDGDPRPPHCTDGQAASSVCDVLEAVLAMSTLLECGFKLEWVLPQSPGFHAFTDMAHCLGNTVEYIEDLSDPWP